MSDSEVTVTEETELTHLSTPYPIRVPGSQNQNKLKTELRLDHWHLV